MRVYLDGGPADGRKGNVPDGGFGPLLYPVVTADITQPVRVAEYVRTASLVDKTEIDAVFRFRGFLDG